MVYIKDFEFSFRELAGSIGDLGTLFPFIIGYIIFSGFDPTGLLLGVGVTKIVLGLYYRMTLPVQPKKVIGSIALAESWPMHRVLGAGFSVGLVWIMLASSRRLTKIIERVPVSIIRGIQLGIALKLALSGANMFFENIILAIPLMIGAIFLLRNRSFPASLFLVISGFLFAILSGNLDVYAVKIALTIPSLHIFSLNDVVQGFLNAGFAQLFLTLTNAVLATMVLLRDFFPTQKDVNPRKLLANMGVINVTVPFIGGMPLCHGAGGLAAQYTFGARTGGALLIEGVIEIILGLLFSQSLLALFTSFPISILGIMLLITSWKLAGVAFIVTNKKEVVIALITAITAIVFNMAVGFVVGLCLYIGIRQLSKSNNLRLDNSQMPKIKLSIEDLKNNLSRIKFNV